ncbi:hypothetical protein FOA43_003426 [Brettanomyces nanus]|uniref:F-box domain-containing protein n=1 Tax=Eeniella nana TaxID=13502 RepID=A0A875RQ71_EENNA|nr:uncharacterized protein FOA43_003426 [Brettanomyces nanus]QPG76040.1 hypothetical protein FOA43_003426 [Brettanomyces nanus]
MRSLIDLPPEIVDTIFKLVPSYLNCTCKFFYVMYNNMYEERFLKEFGSEILNVIAFCDLPYLVDYIKSFDQWPRYRVARRIVSDYYHLPEHHSVDSDNDATSILNCQYIKDSWKFIYGIYKNRCVFIELGDFKVDEFGSQYENGSLKLTGSHLLNYKKTIQLTTGRYRVGYGIVIDGGRPNGLDATCFSLQVHATQEKLITYFPPNMLPELFPKDKFVMLNLGTFYLKPQDDESTFNRLIDVDIKVEESGLYPKTNFALCYMEIRPIPSTNDRISSLPSWLSWWIANDGPEAKHITNVLLMKLYHTINQSLSHMRHDKSANPYQVLGSYRRRQEIGTEKKISGIQDYGHPSGLVYGMTEKEIDRYIKRFFCPYNSHHDRIYRNFKFETHIDEMDWKSRISKDDALWCDDDPLVWKVPHFRDYACE